MLPGLLQSRPQKLPPVAPTLCWRRAAQALLNAHPELSSHPPFQINQHFVGQGLIEPASLAAGVAMPEHSSQKDKVEVCLPSSQTGILPRVGLAILVLLARDAAAVLPP